LIQITSVRDCLEGDRLRYSHHAVEEMRYEPLGRILDSDVAEVIATGEVIRQYPEDRPYPSVLIAGYCGGKPLHIVCAFDAADGMALIVTAYRPDPSYWEDIRTRRVK